MTAITGTVSALLGVALGLFGDRWLRHRGDVHCQIEGLGSAHHRQGAGAAHFKVDQSVQVHFFNEKEVDTGLSEITVVFVHEGGEEVALGPEARGYETSTSPRGVINLPSKTWVSVHIQGSFYGPEARLLEEDALKAIEVKGNFPGGKPYHKRCLELR
jgi:hypothetical protein